MKVKLGDITKYSKGSQINGDELIKEGKYVYMNGGINPSGRWDTYNVRANSITISEGGNSSGYVNFITEPFWCGAHCYYLYDGPKNQKYLYYALKSQQDKLFKLRSGACMPNIKKVDLGRFEFEFNQDEDVQKRIVTILSKLEWLLQSRKKEIDLLDNIIKARFVEMFGDESNPRGWPVVKVKDVANVSVGVVMKPAQYYTDAEHGIRAFRSLNIGPMKIKDTDWVYFSEEGNTKNAKSILKENDLIIVRSGAPGTACVVTKEYEGCNAIDIIIAHPDTSKLNPYYLCAYINLPHGKCQIDQGTGGAAQQHFNVGKYNKLSLFLPPIEKQNEYGEFLDQVNKSKFVPRPN